MSKKLFDSHEMPPPRGPRAEQVRCFEPGEVVAPEGVASMGFAVVLEGTVGIIRRGGTVRILHPQDHLGLESTLTEAAVALHSQGVQCLQDCLLRTGRSGKLHGRESAHDPLRSHVGHQAA